MALGAFRGGPLRVGWAPLAAGGVLAVGAVAYLLVRRRRPAAPGGPAGGAAPATAYGSQPAPRNVYGPTIPMQPGGVTPTQPAGNGTQPTQSAFPNPYPSGSPPPPPPPGSPPPAGPPTGSTPPPSSAPPSSRQLYQIHPQAWGFAPGQTTEAIFSAPSWKSSPLGFVPLGTQFAPTGPPVTGEPATTDLGASSYYLPYAGGFVSAAAATLVPNPSGAQLANFAL